MIIWKRWGIFVVIAFIVGVVFSSMYMDILNVNDVTEMGIIQKIGLGLIYVIIPAGLNWLLWRLFLQKEGTKILTDEAGNQVMINNYSSFFFIRNYYWTYILAAFGLITMVISFF